MKTSHFFPIALVTALFLPGMTKGLCPSITIDMPDIPSGCVGETVIVSPRLEEIAGNCNHMTTYPYKRWNWVVIGDNIVEPMAGNNIPAKFVTVRGGHGKIIFNLICRSRACPDCNRNFEVEREFDVVHVAIEQGSLMVCGKDDWAYLNVTDDTHAPDGVVWTSRPHGIHGHGSSVSFRPSQLVPGAYTVKAANDGTPSCPDVCEVHVIKVNIPTTNIFVCAEDSLASLSLSGDSYSPGSYVWSSTPDGISGCGPDQTITFVPSNLPPGKYVVQCQSADLEDCLDECEVNVIKVDLELKNTGTIVPYPENDAYYAQSSSAGTDQLGPLPMGQGRADFPGQAYTAPIMVIGAVSPPSVPASIEFRWKRYITRRSWYIKQDGGTNWLVTQRSKRGVPTPDDDTGSDVFNDPTPSVAQSKIYMYDCSGLLPAAGGGSSLSVGDFIREEKAFRYAVEWRTSGGTWSECSTMNVGQVIVTKRTNTTGVVANDWEDIENSNETVTLNATISEGEVRSMVGGTLPITIHPDANN